MISSATTPDEIASRVGSLFLKGPIIEVTPILGKGRINRVFIVRDDVKEIVIRVNEAVPTPEALEGYAKEEWCLKQTASVGVPGPTVIQRGQMEDRAYMVQSRALGDNAEDSPADKMYVWRELGRYMKIVHSIDITEEGKSRRESLKALFGPLSILSREDWLQQMQDGINTLSGTDTLEGLNVYSRRQRSKTVELLQQLKALPFRPGLNHGDLTLKNALIDLGGRVSLLDWGSALVQAVPYYDLSQMLKRQVDSNHRSEGQILAFLSGYGLSSTAAQEAVAASAAFLLLRAFGKARWAIGCNHPIAEAFVFQARNAARQLLKTEAGAMMTIEEANSARS